MKKSFLFLLIMIASLSCKKAGNNAPFSDRIIGNWLVVAANSLQNNNGVTVEWGLYYINQVGLRKDHQFSVNGDFHNWFLGFE